MTYCKTCILPDTRPNIEFDLEGNCNCATREVKNRIDWLDRERKFCDLVSEIKAKNAIYDCIIPVSGGKDSTWQTIKALEYGLNPLCVTWRTPARNSLGYENLQNLISLGVSHIDFSINPATEKKFTLKAFEKKGSPVIPMHMALHAIPLQIAVNFRIPLILWGENSAFEYGGSDESLKGIQLTHSWLKQYGVTNGTVAEDWVDDDLTAAELAPYRWPSDSEQANAGVTAIFLGHYFQWDPHMTYAVAAENGFKAGLAPKTGLYEFADIDDEFLITVHHYMKWYKFGFTRLWDNLSLEIRAGRVTRDQAVEMVRESGHENISAEIEKFCDYVNISRQKFEEIVESFRNKEIWHKNSAGKWQISNFLIEDWAWK